MIPELYFTNPFILKNIIDKLGHFPTLGPTSKISGLLQPLSDNGTPYRHRKLLCGLSPEQEVEFRAVGGYLQKISEIIKYPNQMQKKREQLFDFSNKPERDCFISQHSNFLIS